MEAIYFLHDRFYSYEGVFDFNSKKAIDVVRGGKTEKMEVSRTNLYPICYNSFMPMSAVASYVHGVKFVEKIEGGVAFFDIETEGNDFVCGAINEKIFKNSREFMEELMKYRTLAGFNCMRFDLPLLAKKYPEYFHINRIGKFEIIMPRNKLTIDMLFLFDMWEMGINHSLHKLAEKISFSENLLTYQDNKEEKARQDIRIMQVAWEAMQVPKFWEMVCSLINIDRYVMQTVFSSKLRRWIFLNWMLHEKNLIYIDRPKNERVIRNPKPLLLCKKGFYRNIKYHDIKQAYQSMARTTGGLTLFQKNDFKDYMNFLNEHGKKFEMEKLINNAFARPWIGQMKAETEDIRNEAIWRKIVKGFKDKMKTLVDENTIYANTDCVCYTSDREPKLEGFEIKEKNRFSWVYFYHADKWVGFDLLENKIKKKGFQNIYRLKICSHLDKIVEKMLLEYEPQEILKYPLPVSKKINVGTLIKKQMDLFTKVVKKTEGICSDVGLLNIWDNLKPGLNNVFITEKGYALKPNIKFIKRIILEYLDQYSID